MKLHDQEIIPLFSNPFYKAKAKYYVNNVIDFDNINEDEFYGEYVSPDLGNFGRILISKNQNILLDERYSQIKEYCDAAMESYVYDNLKVSRDIKLKLTCSWTLIGYPGCITGKHIHQNSVFSGVFYLKSGPKSGDFILSHPLTMPSCFSPTVMPELVEYNILNAKLFVHNPEDNDIIIFPSHLPHEITRNNSGEIRSCVAFNYFVEGKISGDNTETLSLKVI